MSTHTYAIAEVSATTYAEVRKLLADAGYAHAIHANADGEILDMHGIALCAKPKPPRSVGCNRHTVCADKKPGNNPCCFDEGCSDCFGS